MQINDIAGRKPADSAAVGLVQFKGPVACKGGIFAERAQEIGFAAASDLERTRAAESDIAADRNRAAIDIDQPIIDELEVARERDGAAVIGLDGAVIGQLAAVEIDQRIGAGRFDRAAAVIVIRAARGEIDRAVGQRFDRTGVVQAEIDIDGAAVGFDGAVIAAPAAAATTIATASRFTVPPVSASISP